MSSTSGSAAGVAMDSEEGRKPVRPVITSDDDDEAKDEAPPLTAKPNEEESQEEEDNDDLFGGGGGSNDEDGDDDDDDDDDDDNEEMIKGPGSKRRKAASESRSASPQAGKSARDRSSVTSDDRNDDLELRELSTDPPMAIRDGEHRLEDAEVAEFSLSSLPVRRGAPHFFARLPNMLQYRSDAFEERDFDEVLEDDQLQSRDGIRIEDAGLRSLLTTSNTIRWRWSSQKRDEEGVRIPESNARIVRWSDGSSTLQLGSEFYDITTTTERGQTITQSQQPSQSQSSQSQQTVSGESQSQTSKTIVPPQPVQHLTHLFVKHDGQDQLNIFQAEAPVMGSMTFRPTSITSESHKRLAKAVRQQRGTLVKETVTREDPEAEKERKEREEKKRRQVLAREQRKRQKGRVEEDDDDAFWASAGRTVARRGGAVAGQGAGAYDDDEDVDGLIADDDGFVVEDEEEDDIGTGGERGGRGESEMDEDEPDEMDLMEAEMEKQEALRLASKAINGNDDGKAATSAAEEAQAARRRRIIESDDDDDGDE